MLRRVRHDYRFFLIALAVVAFDQLTKSIIRDSLAIGESWPDAGWLVKIMHITNSGAAFGIFQGAGVFLVITAVVGMAAIIFYYMFPPMEHGIMRVALGLMFGGAVGNLIDRLRFGEVTDFVKFPHYPAFNVADSSITIGLVLIVGFFLLNERKQQPANTEPDAG